MVEYEFSGFDQWENPTCEHIDRHQAREMYRTDCNTMTQHMRQALHMIDFEARTYQRHSIVKKEKRAYSPSSIPGYIETN